MRWVLHLLAIWWYVTALSLLWIIPPHLYFFRWSGMTGFTVSYFVIMYMAVAWYAPVFHALGQIIR